jgi:3-phosphoshikimate 1-carboxyvinyltransferase
MAIRVAAPSRGLTGELRVPGDKSIAHRALLLGALAEGTTVVTGFPGGADVLSSLGAIRALGAVAERAGDTVRVQGRAGALGPTGTTAVDCGNSGTTMRLLAGLVAAGAGTTVLDGDASLRRRPMRRIAEPLGAMGARV